MGSIQAILKAELPSWLIIYTTATSESATSTVCTVAINTTGFYLYYQKIGFTEKAIEAISEKFGTGVTYWTYEGYRLLIGGQGWNCLANYALLFALIPLLNRIRPLNLNIG